MLLTKSIAFYKKLVHKKQLKILFSLLAQSDINTREGRWGEYPLLNLFCYQAMQTQTKFSIAQMFTGKASIFIKPNFPIPSLYRVHHKEKKKREHKTIYFFQSESLPKLLKLTLFHEDETRCFAMSISGSQAPLLRTSMPGLPLFFFQCFYNFVRNLQ